MLDSLATDDDRLYTRQFAQMFSAVLLFMTGVALQFHVGQYIEYLGHGVDVLGRIMSIGMVGTLLMRLGVGRWIDRVGCKPIWLAGAVAFAIATGSMQFATQLWVITLLRALSGMATAAALTTVAVFAAQIAPPRRRAESIGSMGLAGLMGIAVGPTVGDLIFADAADSITPFRIFFFGSAACSLLSGVIVLKLTMRSNPQGAAGGIESRLVGSLRDSAHSNDPSDPAPVLASRPSQRTLVLLHWPGMVLLVGLVFAMAFCVPSMYLERLAEARGFHDVKLFYLVYSPTAILLRIIFRRLPQRIGRSPTMVLGMLLMTAGLCCLLGIDSQWRLIPPGILMGAGHCFIFPSMVDLAAGRFPAEHRGTGTSLILGAGDVGMLIGFGALGELIDAFGFDAALLTLAGLMLVSAGAFSLRRYRANRSRVAGLLR
ncbi:MAG: MFS transporter [Planctomycetes bacterium]|nr:MFS transporter [Planctomycetota bacterium]